MFLGSSALPSLNLGVKLFQGFAVYASNGGF
jgi:hypothetical protein